MESGIHSSFIPHDTEQPGPRARSSPGNLTDFLVLISAVLFIASIVLGLGVFLYQQFLNTSVKSKDAQFTRASEAIDQGLIREFTRLDDRMHVADQILANHNALSVFFHVLEHVTLETVSFRSLSFEASDPQNISIKMTGVAESVNAVALQADLFSKNGIITSPIFSNIDRQADGVHFSLTALINPAAIRYVRLIASVPAAGGAPAPQTGTTAVPESIVPQSSGALQSPQTPQGGSQ
ncbi:MAG: hypothetical protein Q7S05_02775 [bacterium]|nr:hypothetical protein [bacterium]